MAGGQPLPAEIILRAGQSQAAIAAAVHADKVATEAQIALDDKLMAAGVHVFGYRFPKSTAEVLYGEQSVRNQIAVPAGQIALGSLMGDLGRWNPTTPFSFIPLVPLPHNRSNLTLREQDRPTLIVPLSAEAFTNGSLTMFPDQAEIEQLVNSGEVFNPTDFRQR
jgi:hypothetical protein